ncbi:MAG: amidohydrolase family protein [Acidobacteria bacterium]|nr:amidohydrolase family protein [Acidobacteriota bacterium]
MSSAQGPTANPRIINCHCHFNSPAYRKVMQEKVGKHVEGFTTHYVLNTWDNYSPRKAVEDMDKHGIAASMISLVNPGSWFGDPEETRVLVRELNEYGAKMVSDFPGRFGLMAVLPMPIADLCLKEIEYAFDTLKAEGIGLLSSYGNYWLGSNLFQPVFDELNRRRAIVYVHAIDAPCCQDLMPGVGAATLEYNHDTARTIYSLVRKEPPYNDKATRYSNIRFIFSHAGGTMPILIQRYGGVGSGDVINENLANPNPPANSMLYHLRRFYYDTAQSSNIVQMTALKTIAGASQIVYGDDYPFGAEETAERTKHGLQKSGLTPQELQGVYRENAVKLFTRFRS